MKTERLRRYTKELRSLLKMLKHYEANSVDLSDGDKWITENREKLILTVKETAEGLENLESLPSSLNTDCDKNGRRKIRIMEICEGILRDVGIDGEINEEKIKNGIASYQVDGGYLTVSELSSLEIIFSYLYCRRLAVALECGKDTDLGKIIISMFSLPNVDFENIYEETSYSESYFIKDPAGVYVRCDSETRKMYRSRFSDICRKKHLDETKLIEEYYETALKSEGEKKRHIGYYIMKDDKAVGEDLYFFIIRFVPVLVSALLFVIGAKNGDLMFCLLSLPMYFPARKFIKSITNAFFERKIRTYIKPRIDLFRKDIPDEGKTIVTFAVILSNAEKDKSLLNKISNYAVAYKDKNLKFGILADLPDSENASNECENERDLKITENAKHTIDKIGKLGGDCTLFLRKRSYSPTEEKYIGKERKRGALAELFKLLSGEKSELTVYGSNDLSGFKYVLVLDYDSEIQFDDIKKMIGTALHPCNKPEISSENGVSTVEKGYGIFQPNVKISMMNVSEYSNYVLLKNAFQGKSSYTALQPNVLDALMGCGTFCGKGLVNIEAYMSTLNGVFPKESILSHDIAEGEIMNCAFLPDIIIEDTPPLSFCSELKREHRWIRGDVQSLCLTAKHIKDEKGDLYLNPLSKNRKSVLRECVYSKISDMFCLPLLILSLTVCGKHGWIIALALSLDMMYHFFCGLNESLKIPRRRYLSGYPTFRETLIFDVYFKIASLPAAWKNTADAIFRSAYRMLVSKKKMLEWTTSCTSNVQVNGKILDHILSNKTNVVVGLLSITAFALLKTLQSAVLGGLGFIWITFPLVLYRVESKNTSADGKVSDLCEKEKHGNELKNEAKLIWNFFEHYVEASRNHLPPDNITSMPKKAVAERTSPTNIGMYLVSAVNAYDFGFITKKMLFERLENTIGTLEKMEKWKGHFYNWYDVKSLKVLYPMYISTVDSGNLMISLETVKNALNEFTEECVSLKDRIEKLIGGADFYDLYNPKRNLFYIGWFGNKNEYDKNVYDLYMSEMLMTSFYAVAKMQIPTSHLQLLSKIHRDERDCSPMLSWSGTGFEYFMAALFLPFALKTERGEALLCAAEKQRENCASFENCSIYGVSESSYYDFDNEMNYFYTANGIDSLAMSSVSSENRVFSPYSLCLILGIDEKAPSTIESLIKTPLHGKYGLFEACDLTERRVGQGYGIVKQYMSHHMGMSMAAIANYCLGNINVKRFSTSPEISAALPYLFNKIEICRRYSGKTASEMKVPYRKFNERNGELLNTEVALIGNGRIRVMADRAGHIAIYDQNTLIADSFDERMGEFCVCVLRNGKVFDCLDPGEEISTTKSDLLFDGASIRYVNEVQHGNEIVKTELEIFTDAENPDVIFSLNVSGVDDEKNEDEDEEILCFFTPVINRKSSYESAPSYSELFVISDVTENGAKFERRGGDEEERIEFEALKNTALSKIFVKKDDIVPFLYNKNDIFKTFYKRGKYQSGACVHPVCASVMKSADKGAATGKSYAWRICCGSETDKTKGSADISAIYEKAQNYFMLKSSLAGADNEIIEKAMTVLDKIINSERDIARAPEIKELFYEKNILWRHGISGDLPIVSVLISGRSNSKNEYIIKEMLKIKRFLFISGIRFDMLFITSESGYFEDVTGKIVHFCRSCGCGDLLKKNNGIFLISESELSQNDMTAICAVSAYFEACESKKNPAVFKEQMKSRKSRNSAFVNNTNAENKLLYSSGMEAEFSNGRSSSPWCMIYANGIFGTLLTNRTLGFTWYKNSAMSNVTRRHLDPLKGIPGENIELLIDEKAYDIASCAEKVRYGEGSAVYYGEADGISYEVSVGVDPKLPVKLYFVKIASYKNTDRVIRCRINIFPSVKSVITEKGIKLLDDLGTTMKLFSVSDEINCETENGRDNVSVRTDFTEEGKCAFVFSAFPDRSIDLIVPHLMKKFDSAEKVCFAFAEYEKRMTSLLGCFVKCESRISDQFPFSLLQTYIYRLTARTGYSQSGGAYGFRDQLQDSLSALYFSPEITKRQILRSCAVQYENGRVQHWWHPGIGGLKSRCSDDFMWLPYVIGEYISATSDVSVLDLKVPFLSSPPLGDNEEDRYEKAEETARKYTVLEHALRAVESSLERGAHGLPLMLSGDWNDGMNSVGREGRGESVWLAFFFAVSYKKLASALEKYLPERKDISNRLYALADELVYSAEFAWDGGWYIRAYDDDGIPLGSKNCKECRIDVIPQAFSVFAGAKRERSVIAMKNAEALLYDRKYRIFRLFSPSFSETEKYGYICNYPAGIRENGGQYTHAAIWAAAAYFELGEYEMGYEIMKAVSPFYIYDNGKSDGNFSSEPYLLCADIYYGNGITGKNGWSGYTGSSGWYYRTAMKYCFGIEPTDGKFKISSPRSRKDDYYVSFMYNGVKTEIDVVFRERCEEVCDENYDYVYEIREKESIMTEIESADVKILIKVIS